MKRLITSILLSAFSAFATFAIAQEVTFIPPHGTYASGRIMDAMLSIKGNYDTVLEGVNKHSEMFEATVFDPTTTFVYIDKKSNRTIDYYINTEYNKFNEQGESFLKIVENDGTWLTSSTKISYHFSLEKTLQRVYLTKHFEKKKDAKKFVKDCENRLLYWHKFGSQFNSYLWESNDESITIICANKREFPGLAYSHYKWCVQICFHY